MSRTARIALLTFGITGGCGSGSPSFTTDAAARTDARVPNEVSGTTNGKTFTAQSAAFNTIGDSCPPGYETEIAISTTPTLCQGATQNYLIHDSQSLTFYVYDHDTAKNFAAAVTAPGTYPLYDLSLGVPAGATKVGYSSVYQLSQYCHVTGSARSTSGTITLLTVSALEITGTFDLLLDTGDHITGWFDAPDCPALYNVAPACATCR